MSRVYDQVLLVDTFELVDAFERALGYELVQEDRLEIMKQLFFILDQHSPLDLSDRNILTYDALIFANHLKVDHVAVDQIAYHLMVGLWQILQTRGFYGDHGLHYFPYAMQGYDLCVRYYKN